MMELPDFGPPLGGDPDGKQKTGPHPTWRKEAVRNVLLVLLLVLSVNCCGYFDATAQGGHIVIHFRSIDVLRQKCLVCNDTITEMFGEQQLDHFARSVPKAIDVLLPKLASMFEVSADRRFGAYWPLTSLKVDPAHCVVFIPCEDHAKVIDILDVFHMIQPANNGAYKVNTPSGDEFYLRFESKYAYISAEEDLVSSVMSIDERLIATSEKESDITLAVDCYETPLLLSVFVATTGVQALDTWISAEQSAFTADVARNRSEIRQLLFDALQHIRDDTERLSLMVNGDESSSELRLHLALEAREGSAMAGSFRKFGRLISILDRSPMEGSNYLHIHLPVASEIQQMLSRSVHESSSKAIVATDRGTIADQLQSRRMLQVLAPILEAPEIDFSVVVTGEHKDHEFGFGGVLRYADTTRYESEIRRIALDESRDAPMIQLDAESHLGTPIHRINMTPLLQSRFRSNRSVISARRLNTFSSYFAFLPGTVIVGDEAHGLELVKARIESFKATKDLPTSSVPIELSVSVSQIERFVPSKDNAELRDLLLLEAGTGVPRDRISVSVFGEQRSLNMRIVVQADLVRLALRSFYSRVVLGLTPGQKVNDLSPSPPATRESPPEISNSIGMKLKLIPAGEFMMGSSNADVAAALEADWGLKKDSLKNEQPQHKVTIGHPFYAGVYEVTQEEYEKVMGANPSWFSPAGGGSDKVSGMSTSRFPVEQVSWYDAIEFCNKLSQRDNLPPYYSITSVNRAAGRIESASVTLASRSVYSHSASFGSRNGNTCAVVVQRRHTTSVIC